MLKIWTKQKFTRMFITKKYIAEFWNFINLLTAQYTRTTYIIVIICCDSQYLKFKYFILLYQNAKCKYKRIKSNQVKTNQIKFHSKYSND